MSIRAAALARFFRSQPRCRLALCLLLSLMAARARCWAGRPSSSVPSVAVLLPPGAVEPLSIGLVGTFGHPTRLDVWSDQPLMLRAPDGTATKVDGRIWLDTVSGEIAVHGGDGEVIAHGDPVTVAPVGSGTSWDNALITVCAGRICRHYRGILRVQMAKGGRLLAVNEIGVEEYLRGVVPVEMGSQAPAEALKAQAIVCRTYALKMRARYRREGFDITDDTACQVYGGADAERSATDAAVRDTEGMVVVRNHQLVLADYYDDCGGITAPGGDPDDFPPSVRDAPDGGPDYCARGRYHKWDLRLTPEELGLLLAKAFPGQIAGPIQDVAVTEMDASGRAKALVVRGPNAALHLTGARLRAAVGVGRLRSTLFTVERASDGSFLFSGRGYGHGHGMCQEGAKGMAADPYRMTYLQILEHYYPSAEVVKDYGYTSGAGG